MKKIIFFLLIVLSMAVKSAAQNNNELKLFENELAELLYKKGDINEERYESIKEKGFGEAILGIYNVIDPKNLKEGIYSFSWGPHSLVYFLIYENKKVRLLDISSQKNLLRSIKGVIEFSDKNEYCSEIINKYISTLVGVYYSINKNLNTRLDVNCEFEKRPIKSYYSISQIQINLAEYLVGRKEIKDLQTYLDNPEILLLENTGIYYGIPSKDEALDVGIYYFFNIEKSQPKYYYLLINRDSYEIINLNKKDGLYEGISEILKFGNANKFCHKIMQMIIRELIENHYNNKCLDVATEKLP